MWVGDGEAAKGVWVGVRGRRRLQRLMRSSIIALKKMTVYYLLTTSYSPAYRLTHSLTNVPSP